MLISRNEAVTKKEAASLLDVVPNTVAIWTRAGYLERAIIGNKWYLTLKSVRDLRGKPVKLSQKGPYYYQNRELVLSSPLAEAWKAKTYVEEEDNGLF